MAVDRGGPLVVVVQQACRSMKVTAGQQREQDLLLF